MSIRKTLRLRLSALKEIGVNPYDETELLDFIQSTFLPPFVAGNNEYLERAIQLTKTGCKDIFDKYPLLLGTLESLGITNNGLVSTVPLELNNGYEIQAIGVGDEVIKWLWRPAVYVGKNIRVGTALIEYSLAKNILLKVDHTMVFVQRQCYQMELKNSINSINSITSVCRNKEEQIIDGQMSLFQELNYSSKIVNFPIKSLYLENSGFYIEFAA